MCAEEDLFPSRARCNVLDLRVDSNADGPSPDKVDRDDGKQGTNDHSLFGSYSRTRPSASH